MTKTWIGKHCDGECSDSGSSHCRCWIMEQSERIATAEIVLSIGRSDPATRSVRVMRVVKGRI